MKHFLLFIILCLSHVSLKAGNSDISMEDNVIYAVSLSVSAGEDTKISFNMKNTAEIRGFGFKLYLPEGVNVIKRSDGYAKTSLSKDRLPVFDDEDVTDDHSLLATEEDGVVSFLCNSMQGYAFTGNEGEICTLSISVDANMAQGDYPIIIREMALNGITHDEKYTKDYLESTLSVGAPADSRTTFDENSDNGDVLKAATGVDVRVKRTIKADQWSTICLPFAMTAEQVVSAFGSDVQLADFSSWKVTDEDAEGEPTAIKIGFTTVDVAQGMEANHPYMIKVGAAVNEFTADGVTISPSDSHEKVVGTGSKKGQFIGVFKAGTTVPEECLFLSDNKFWYSTGSTAIKAFRGYFKLKKVIAGYYDEAESHVQMVFDEGEATGISGVRHEINDDRYYNLSGQRVENPKKGLYIKNNKKVVVK